MPFASLDSGSLLNFNSNFTAVLHVNNSWIFPFCIKFYFKIFPNLKLYKFKLYFSDKCRFYGL